MPAKWKIFASLHAICTVLTLWYFYEEPLDEETKQWLIEPPAVAEADYVRTYIKLLDRDSTSSLSDVMDNNSCNTLNIECAKCVESHRQEISGRLPHDPEYWMAFEQSLVASSISADLSVVKNNQVFYGNYLAAVQLSFIQELVEQG